MTIRTYDKDGNPNNVCWQGVQKVKLMVIPGTGWRDTLLELHLTFEDGQEVDYYLSEHERFAVIEEEN